MSLKVDHQTISDELRQTHLKAIRLFFAATGAYPDVHPYVSDVVSQTSAIGTLNCQLSSLYDSEVSSIDHGILGRLYEPDLDEEQWEIAVGATEYVDEPEHERHGLSKAETMEAGRCVIEIGESLAYVGGLISRYDPHHQVNVALRKARACNVAVGSHVGLRPKSAIRLA